MIKISFLFAFLLIPTAAMSLAVGMSHGHGALLYDATQSNGPNPHNGNKPTNLAGQWKDNILQFNASASPKTQITRLYPYSGDIEMDCSTLSSCVYSGAGQNVFALYTKGFGPASVAAYRAHFPSALILAIIDADLDSLPLLSNQTVGVNVANMLTQQLCSDPNVDGVFFDLEPISPNAFQTPGLFALYKQTATNLANCKDAKHPNGRYMAVFINPNKIPDWSQLAEALGHNGYVVVGAYDINDQSPPYPTEYSAYTSSINGKIGVFMDPNSQIQNISYTIAIPAASSFSEFEQFGTYVSQQIPFSVITDFTKTAQITQLGYVQLARDSILTNAKSPYYLGIDYWAWSQYKSPAPNNNWLLLPNIPPNNVVAYLQQFG